MDLLLDMSLELEAAFKDKTEALPKATMGSISDMLAGVSKK